MYLGPLRLRSVPCLCPNHTLNLSHLFRAAKLYVPRLHCPAFFALWKSPAVFFQIAKNAGQWSLGMRLELGYVCNAGVEAW